MAQQRVFRNRHNSIASFSGISGDVAVTSIKNGSSGERASQLPKDGKTFKDFIVSAGEGDESKSDINAPDMLEMHSPADAETEQVKEKKPLRYFIETYGCQMNVADSEIVHSVLQSQGHIECAGIDDADVIMANTCAIRENAEMKIWNRIAFFNSMKTKNRLKKKHVGFPLVGVLGCMAERLKERLLEEDGVDFVCGPDAYRSIPRLLDQVTGSTDQKAANVQLSLDETYADIKPVRHASSIAAFVSIMRGCNNMCSYCIVPFTRGRERSRDIESIVQEIRSLSNEGVKEVMLLGQNVNSYHDSGQYSLAAYPNGGYNSASGFKNLYRLRDGAGARFADLLDAVSIVDPEMRVRFTSPHPKDFPDEVSFFSTSSS
jgi:MiaB/RimO family radical SAM methylthiotransferase